jgi:hypothetical protein
VRRAWPLALLALILACGKVEFDSGSDGGTPEFDAGNQSDTSMSSGGSVGSDASDDVATPPDDASPVDAPQADAPQADAGPLTDAAPADDASIVDGDAADDTASVEDALDDPPADYFVPDASSCPGGCSVGDCIGGVCGKAVFVTSQSFTGNVGGLAGADAICQTLAIAAGLPGKYLAWLSTMSSPPSKRFQKFDGPYVLVDGTIVANDWGDLTDGTLESPIVLTESGALGSAAVAGICGSSVWTGTDLDGFATNTDDCDGWTSATGTHSVTYGDFGAVDNQWTNGCYRNEDGDCSVVLPLLCFEQ